VASPLLRRALVTAMAIGALTLAIAPAASAAPPSGKPESSNASCVPKIVHIPFQDEGGPPGQKEREIHITRFGQHVSKIAHLSNEECQALISTATK
jgi:hypothetical protein